MDHPVFQSDHAEQVWNQEGSRTGRRKIPAGRDNVSDHMTIQRIVPAKNRQEASLFLFDHFSAKTSILRLDQEY